MTITFYVNVCLQSEHFMFAIFKQSISLKDVFTGPTSELWTYYKTGPVPLKNVCKTLMNNTATPACPEGTYLCRSTTTDSSKYVVYVK